MASSPPDTDALLTLRTAIAQNVTPLLSTTEDAATGTDNFAQATHLHFTLHGTGRSQTFDLNSATRYTLDEKPVDLRSVYFAWLNRDLAVTAYLAKRGQTQRDLAAAGIDAELRQLNFGERTDLVAWLDGTNVESENITPLAGEKAAAQVDRAAAITAGTADGAPAVSIGKGDVKSLQTVDPKLERIYKGERKMGDRNSILRGVKPTSFAHVKTQADAYLGRVRVEKNTKAAATTTNPALVSNLKKPGQPGRRLEPIILLSPSASSLLRMSNIKQFLEDGIFVPADSAAAGSMGSANLLYTSRLMPSIDSQRPFRFILVDTPDQFKPDYWQRVVAVFTTGQTWQFKSYKWQRPQEMFEHALGVYVGWNGERIPEEVRGWGRLVKICAVDKWMPSQGEKGRWRDREVVEGLWSAVEHHMKMHGWSKEGFTG